MPVNAVNNVSFGTKTRNLNSNDAKKAEKEKYYKWVSQQEANDVLKMSVGREVEDGKYKFASAITGAVGLLGSFSSFLLKSNVISEISTFGAQGPMPLKAYSKLRAKNTAANLGLIASLALLTASSIIKNVNIKKADKTANERGFLSTKDRMKINDAQVCYAVTDEIYKSHVN